MIVATTFASTDRVLAAEPLYVSPSFANLRPLPAESALEEVVGMVISAVPSKEIPLIKRAVVSLAADDAVVAFPERAPSKVPAISVSAPNDHLSTVSFHSNSFEPAVPRLTERPAFSVGLVPVKLLFRTMTLSARLICSVLIVVTDPDTVRSPVTERLPPIVALLVVTIVPVLTAPVVVNPPAVIVAVVVAPRPVTVARVSASAWRYLLSRLTEAVPVT